MNDGSIELPTSPSTIRAELVDWFDEHHRSFPWREVDDPWAILVVEVMSQQTQLERVTDPWSAFIDRWPTPNALAETPKGEVVAFWSEHRLGYNRRAAHLHDAATRIVETFDGQVPSDPAALETLAGVGPYTANAVAGFAFQTGSAVVDTNVERVLYRAFGLEGDAVESVADRLAGDQPGQWNEAVMELGGIACTTTPSCDESACPLRRWCEAYATGDFTAPDVPTQPSFDGSRRQYRGRVLSVLRDGGPETIDELGHRIRVDYDPTTKRDWLIDLLEDLAEDDLILIDETEPRQVRLER